MKSIVPITVALLLCFAGLSQGCCPTFWSQYKGGRCYRYVGTPMTWYQARDYCYHLDIKRSRLATLNSAEEANHVHSIWQEAGDEKHGAYWIGYHSYNRGSFQWDDQSTSRWTFWGKSEPDNKAKEECTEIRSDQRWYDQVCTYTRGFFCEMARP